MHKWMQRYLMYHMCVCGSNLLYSCQLLTWGLPRDDAYTIPLLRRRGAALHSAPLPTGAGGAEELGPAPLRGVEQLLPPPRVRVGGGAQQPARALCRRLCATNSAAQSSAGSALVAAAPR